MAAGELDGLTGEMNAQVAATNAEAGCLLYCFARDVANPDTLIISERWENQAAIDAHFKSPHMATFNAVLSKATVLDVSVRSYDLETGAIVTLIGG